jgi:hypothetical protein
MGIELRKALQSLAEEVCNRIECERLRQEPSESVAQTPFVPGPQQTVEQRLDGVNVAEAKCRASLTPRDGELELSERVERVAKRAAPLRSGPDRSHRALEGRDCFSIGFACGEVGQSDNAAHVGGVGLQALLEHEPRRSSVAERQVPVRRRREQYWP